MKSVKKLIKALSILFLLIGFQASFAVEVKDVKANYWAAKEISNSIINNYLSLNDKNEFLPENTITRSEFVTGLVKVLGGESLNVFMENELKDLKTTTKNYKEIMIAEQLRIIYGYPDKTFKPDVAVSRAEAESALGHIIKGNYSNPAILDRFKDKKEVPAWSIPTYSRAIKNGFYINYPDRTKLRPTEKLTRAEAAVLYDRVLKGLDLVDAKYKKDLKTVIPDTLLSTEELKICSNALTDVVEIYNTKKVIKAGNIIEGRFDNPLHYKKAKVGDIVEFTAPRDVITEQGTTLYRQGTKFNSEVIKIKKTAWREHNTKTLLVLDRISTTDGYNYEMAGVPLSRDKQFLWWKWSKLIYTKDKNTNWMPKKNPRERYSEAEFLLRYGYKVSPRVRYHNKPEDEVYILLTDDLIFRDKPNVVEE